MSSKTILWPRGFSMTGAMALALSLALTVKILVLGLANY